MPRPTGNAPALGHLEPIVIITNKQSLYVTKMSSLKLNCEIKHKSDACNKLYPGESGQNEIRIIVAKNNCTGRNIRTTGAHLL